MDSLRAEGNTVRYLYFRIFLQDHKGQNARNDFMKYSSNRKGEKKNTPRPRSTVLVIVMWWAGSPAVI